MGWYLLAYAPYCSIWSGQHYVRIKTAVSATGLFAPFHPPNGDGARDLLARAASNSSDADCDHVTLGCLTPEQSPSSSIVPATKAGKHDRRAVRTSQQVTSFDVHKDGASAPVFGSLNRPWAQQTSTMVKSASLIAGAASLFTAQACVTIQHQFPYGQGGVPSKAAAIAQEYRNVWNEYAKYAFGKDDLLPLNQSYVNDLFGFGATIVDGIDTAVVMGLTDIVSAQLEYIYNRNFNKPDSLVDEFDAMIRYIGGLLSAYDLINSPIVPKGTYNQAHVEGLLNAAKTISNHLKPMFNSPSGLPYGNINFTTSQYSNCQPISPCNSTAVDTAVTGSLILEWYRLSDLTGDSSYRTLAERCENNLISPSQTLIHPGIVGSSLDINTGKYTNFEGGWQAGIDSFYEYLIKTYIYAPTEPDTVNLKNFWLTTVDSTMKYLASHPYQRPELTFISQLDNNGVQELTMDDYACFAGGNLILGGKYLGRADIFDFGIAVTDSCHALFNTSAAGLNPTRTLYAF